MSPDECPNRIGYEVIVVGPDDPSKYTSLILKIDGQEFTLDKDEVSRLEGIINVVYDRMVYPLDVYLRQEPTVRVA